jgi:hypothetical protein
LFALYLFAGICVWRKNSERHTHRHTSRLSLRRINAVSPTIRTSTQCHQRFNTLNRLNTSTQSANSTQPSHQHFNSNAPTHEHSHQTQLSNVQRHQHRTFHHSHQRSHQHDHQHNECHQHNVTNTSAPGHNRLILSSLFSFRKSSFPFLPELNSRDRICRSLNRSPALSYIFWTEKSLYLERNITSKPPKLS